MLPKVTVGMPVFNGQSYLRESLDSLLGQSFGDFELIISDNASTDLTGQICEQYAAVDKRIRYYRSEKNFGAARNFNRLVELARGIYFKWAAHDDICDPAFLEKNIQALDEDKSASIAYARTAIFDERCNKQSEYKDGLNLTQDSPHERFGILLEKMRRGNECHPVFGLMRIGMLRRTGLIRPYVSSDEVLLGELSLRGKFREMPEYLFFKRQHSNRSMTAFISLRSRSAWFDPKNKGKLQLHKWRMLADYIDSVRRASIAQSEKWLCYLAISKWAAFKTPYLTKDIAKAIIWPFVPDELKSQSRKEIQATNERISPFCRNDNSSFFNRANI
ncbi:MAG: glycosyltransferase family 2 protein [Phycisphaerae bacterium]|nr:glycosyltransferase family 2 protein [Phycisphaerae bacterium]